MNKHIDLGERDSKVIELFGKDMKASEIAKEVGICKQTVFNILERYGLHTPKKHNKARTNKVKQNNKKCPACKAVNNPKEAKFCCMCGADIRSKVDILIADLNAANKACCSHLPFNVNEKVRDAILEAIKYIEETNK